MLTFLRKIRRSIIKSGSVLKLVSPGGRYVLYAIGDIVLVVIGILIALGVNNWNQNRQALDFEEKLLVELRKTINDNYVWIDFMVQSNQSSIQSNMIILDHLDNELPYHDSLNRHFANSFVWFELTLKKNSFESAKDYGLHFIKNDTTRGILSEVYENRGPFLNRFDDRLSLSYYTSMEPVILKHFDSANNNHLRGTIHQTYEMNPIDYELLKEDNQFKSILRTNVGNREKLAFFVNWVLEGMQEVDYRLNGKLKSVIKA